MDLKNARFDAYPYKLSSQASLKHSSRVDHTTGVYW